MQMHSLAGQTLPMARGVIGGGAKGKEKEGSETLERSLCHFANIWAKPIRLQWSRGCILPLHHMISAWHAPVRVVCLQAMAISKLARLVT